MLIKGRTVELVQLDEVYYWKLDHIVFSDSLIKKLKHFFVNHLAVLKKIEKIYSETLAKKHFLIDPTELVTKKNIHRLNLSRSYVNKKLRQLINKINEIDFILNEINYQEHPSNIHRQMLMELCADFLPENYGYIIKENLKIDTLSINRGAKTDELLDKFLLELQKLFRGLNLNQKQSITMITQTISEIRKSEIYFKRATTRTYVIDDEFKKIDPCLVIFAMSEDAISKRLMRLKKKTNSNLKRT